MKKRNIVIFLMSMLLLVSNGCRKEKNKQEEDPTTDPVEVTEEDKVSFNLVDYTTYKVDDKDAGMLSFNYVIAKVRIKDEGEISYSLKDLVTSEKVNLGQLDSYYDEINRAGTTLKDFNLSEDLRSSSNNALFTLFIPVNNKKADEITVTFLDKYSIDFDLSRNVKSIVFQQAELHEIDADNFIIEVKTVVDATGENLLMNGEVTGASNFDLYAFRLTVTPLSGNSIKIEDAEYVSASTSDSFKALDARYETEKKDNLISVKLTEETTGYLFFQVLNPEKEELSYKGILRIKVDGQWYNVNVDL